MKYGHSVLIFFLLRLAASCGENHEQMLLQLEELERQNRAYEPMTNDTLALQLANYFDRYGTANERLRAHYMVGCTYRDMGEAPPALNAYLDAADCADTTDVDCDYRTLSAVYSQMADVFHGQLLLSDEIEGYHYYYKADSGTTIFNGTVNGLKTFNTTSWASGIYIIRAMGDGQTFVRQLLY